MPGKKKTTLKEIAEYAHLSMSTVSGVVNNLHGFSEETRKKVWDAVHVLNYVPNTQAKRLRCGNDSGRRLRSGLLMRIKYYGTQYPWKKRFDADLSQKFEETAARYGYFMTNYHYVREEGFRCPVLLNELIDGVVIKSPHPEVIHIVRNKLPAVLLDISMPFETAGIPSVNADMKQGFLDAFRDLKASGHIRIAQLDARPVQPSFNKEKLNYDALRGAADYCGLEIPESADLRLEWNDSCSLREQIVIAALRIQDALRKEIVSAVATTNFHFAAILLEELEKLGVRCPEDVEIVAGSHLMENPLPQIATVRNDWDKLIEMSLELLIRQIDGRALPGDQFFIASHYHKRS